MRQFKTKMHRNAFGSRAPPGPAVATILRVLLSCKTIKLPVMCEQIMASFCVTWQLFQALTKSIKIGGGRTTMLMPVKRRGVFLRHRVYFQVSVPAVVACMNDEYERELLLYCSTDLELSHC